MSFDGGPDYPKVRPGPLWQLLMCLAIIGGNMYLLLSLSPWWGVVAMIETLVALTLTAIALVRAARKRGPTPLQVLLWSCLAAVWLLYPLRSRVIDHRVQQAGTERLLQDARDLAGGVGVSDVEPEDLDPENLLVPASFRRLNPRLVRVRAGSVELVHDIGISSFEAIVIDTDPNIIPGPVQRAQETESKEAGWDISRRLIAPGIEWYCAST